MGQVNEHPELIAFDNHPLAEFGKTAVGGLLGLIIPDAVLEIVHELHVADALLIGGGQSRKIVIKKVGALSRQDYVGIAMNSVINIGCLDDDLKVVVGDMTLDSRHLTLEPSINLSRVRDFPLSVAVSRRSHP